MMYIQTFIAKQTNKNSL